MPKTQLLYSSEEASNVSASERCKALQLHRTCKLHQAGHGIASEKGLWDLRSAKRNIAIDSSSLSFVPRAYLLSMPSIYLRAKIICSGGTPRSPASLRFLLHRPTKRRSWSIDSIPVVRVILDGVSHFHAQFVSLERVSCSQILQWSRGVSQSLAPVLQQSAVGAAFRVD